jgi:hypothetical protein
LIQTFLLLNATEDWAHIFDGQIRHLVDYGLFDVMVVTFSPDLDPEGSQAAQYEQAQK